MIINYIYHIKNINNDILDILEYHKKIGYPFEKFPVFLNYLITVIFKFKIELIHRDFILTLQYSVITQILIPKNYNYINSSLKYFLFKTVAQIN